jgi:RNA polymerase sigma-70 factor (family 1)
LAFYTHHTDKLLFEFLKNDDYDAFNELYSRYWQPLYLSAFQILKDRQPCMDIVQDIFVWLWDNRKTVQVEQPQAYLKAAVRFKIANLFRAGRVRDSFYMEILNAPVSSGAANPESMLELKELQAMVLKAIADLPDKCRQVFELSRNNKLSNQQIASKLGLSIKTVENQITIALRRIRSQLSSFLISLTLIFNLFGG